MALQRYLLYIVFDIAKRRVEKEPLESYSKLADTSVGISDPIFWDVGYNIPPPKDH